MLPELSRGLTPYAVNFDISRGEFERRIASEAVEIGAAFGGDDRLVVRPRQGRSDAVEFAEDERLLLIGCVLVHNHPQGGPPSPEDGAFAAAHNVAELRIILPTGRAYAIHRPEEGWPTSDSMLMAMRQGSVDALAEKERRRLAGSGELRGTELQEFLFEARQRGLRSIGVEMARGSVWEA